MGDMLARHRLTRISFKETWDFLKTEMPQIKDDKGARKGNP